MIFTYMQAQGLIWCPDGKLLGNGYSGAPGAKNDFKQQRVKNVGPIPIGMWTIDGYYDSDSLGPAVIVLNPHRHDACGRTFFRIHGDSRDNPGDASKGCIVLKKEMRLAIIEAFKRAPFDSFLMVIQ